MEQWNVKIGLPVFPSRGEKHKQRKQQQHLEQMRKLISTSLTLPPPPQTKQRQTKEEQMLRWLTFKCKIDFFFISYVS